MLRLVRAYLTLHVVLAGLRVQVNQATQVCRSGDCNIATPGSHRSQSVHGYRMRRDKMASRGIQGLYRGQFA